jgi:hypothetical protein
MLLRVDCGVSARVAKSDADAECEKAPWAPEAAEADVEGFAMEFGGGAYFIAKPV